MGGQVFDEVVAKNMVATRRMLLDGASCSGFPFPEGFFRRPASRMPAGEAWAANYPEFPTGASAIPIGTLVASPFFVYEDTTIDGLAFIVNALGGAGSVARAGIWSTREDTLYPLGLLVDGGQFACDAATGGKIANVSVPVQGGTVIWLGYLCGVAAPTVVRYAQGHIVNMGFTVTAGSNVPVENGWLTVAQAYGALPDPFPAGATYLATPANSAAVFVRFAS